MTASVARALRGLVDEIKEERGEVEDYLILDDVLERLPRYAAELEACAEMARIEGDVRTAPISGRKVR